MIGSEQKSDAARLWFGYGRWSAPYWFIGKEPGGSDDPENYASWARLGAKRGAYDLIDCREHDLDYRGENSGEWHVGLNGRKPHLQRTWSPLIRVLLSYLGEYCDNERIRDYQINRWGHLDRDTCVAELSAIAAPSTHSLEAMRLLHREQRIATLRTKILAERPAFVHFSGTGIYPDYWREIADAPLVENEPMRIGSTVFVYTKHPTAHGMTSEFWIALGKRLQGV